MRQDGVEHAQRRRIEPVHVLDDQNSGTVSEMCEHPVPDGVDCRRRDVVGMLREGRLVDKAADRMQAGGGWERGTAQSQHRFPRIPRQVFRRRGQPGFPETRAAAKHHARYVQAVCLRALPAPRQPRPRAVAPDQRSALTGSPRVTLPQHAVVADQRTRCS